MTSDKESARGLAQLEGFLLWNAEVERARRRACRFTDQLPWLTTAQREDVERVFVAEHVITARESLIRVRTARRNCARSTADATTASGPAASPSPPARWARRPVSVRP